MNIWLIEDSPSRFEFYVPSCEILQIMSDRGEMKEESEEISPRTFKGKPPKCYKCGAIGHVEKWVKLVKNRKCLTNLTTRYCWGLRTVYMGDLPPSVTEEWVRELVGDIGVLSYLKVFFKSRRKILTNLRWGWMWRMEASTHFWGWKVGRLGTPSSKHSTSRFSLLVKDYDWSRWTRWSIQLWLCFWMMWIMSPIDNLSFLGGEGERNHCEVERGWDVDLRRPFLWEKQLRHLRRVRPLQAQEEGCSLRKFNWHSVSFWKLHIYISRGIN